MVFEDYMGVSGPKKKWKYVRYKIWNQWWVEMTLFSGSRVKLLILCAHFWRWEGRRATIVNFVKYLLLLIWNEYYSIEAIIISHINENIHLAHILYNSLISSSCIVFWITNLWIWGIVDSSLEFPRYIRSDIRRIYCKIYIFLTNAGGWGVCECLRLYIFR